uniref:Septin n=1 Tax=Parastrongyloides trichosuri TaxID=131310 RepID=A0A0N4ZH99_PARTI
MITTNLKRSVSQHIPETNDYIGVVNYTNQVFRRAVKNGFEFTIMVVGCSGLGKSTFLNTLFCSELEKYEDNVIPSTKKIVARSYYLTENKVKVKLTLVDTPGFGDSIDNSNCWKPIMEYIDSKYSQYLSEETKIGRRTKIPDERVHLCLYFITPTGHSLKEIDIKFMKNLHDKVNIIPLIAKADTLTPSEMARFKQNVLNDIEKNGIKIYNFESEDNDENKQAYSRVPYGVVCSNHLIENKAGKKVRVREYPWGVVEVDNLKHNDFIAMKEILLKKHLIDLICDTANVHYENFRFTQLSGPFKGSNVDCDPMSQMERENKILEEEFEASKRNMEKIFSEKVIDWELRLKERENKLSAIEKEQRQLLISKRQRLDELTKEIQELKFKAGCVENNSSKSSPQEKKKKSSTLGLFHRNTKHES